MQHFVFYYWHMEKIIYNKDKKRIFKPQKQRTSTLLASTKIKRSNIRQSLSEEQKTNKSTSIKEWLNLKNHLINKKTELNLSTSHHQVNSIEKLAWEPWNNKDRWRLLQSCLINFKPALTDFYRFLLLITKSEKHITSRTTTTLLIIRINPEFPTSEMGYILIPSPP